MSGYVAYGENTTMICSYDRRASKALKKAARVIDKIMSNDEYANLSAINVYLDEDGYYQITAITSTMRY